MDFEKIRAELRRLLEDQSLFEETNLYERNDAIGYIDYAGDALSIPGMDRKSDPVYQKALIIKKKIIAPGQIV